MFIQRRLKPAATKTERSSVLGTSIVKGVAFMSDGRFRIVRQIATQVELTFMHIFGFFLLKDY